MLRLTYLEEIICCYTVGLNLMTVMDQSPRRCCLDGCNPAAGSDCQCRRRLSCSCSETAIPDSGAAGAGRIGAVAPPNPIVVAGSSLTQLQLVSPLDPRFNISTTFLR